MNGYANKAIIKKKKKISDWVAMHKWSTKRALPNHTKHAWSRTGPRPQSPSLPGLLVAINSLLIKSVLIEIYLTGKLKVRVDTFIYCDIIAK